MMNTASYTRPSYARIETMKVAIFGAGAIGGLLGFKLAKAGVDVTLVARGPQLAALQQNGLTLIRDGERDTVAVRAVGSAAEAGIQDYVFVTLKAHSLPGAAPSIAQMMGPDSALVTGINGVPYWYFYGLEGEHANRRVESVDPGGKLWDIIPPSQAIGCVVYPASEVVEPGVIEHTYGDRFSLGEPDGSRSPRIDALSKAMIAAGLKAPVRPRIRDEIWVKLWGNLCFNPISALTGATLDIITTRPDLRQTCRGMMGEAQIVAEKLGVRFGIDLEKRIDGAAEVGVHKTSMLQDLERGRPMEIDALLGAVVELGHVTGTPMPSCELVLALVRERARQSGCYEDPQPAA
ncbi:Ketopantoate reductase PanE/ApbA family protein [Granulibacter bethesdensis]|uniref:2-dehydropantoate 2-reductase n=1 Tax=Granulibacter bethesdensis TaxID=364410 RepID=A0AAC9K9E2_9PROT|nr:2-dehydropantoate 2-reductase [Granulibacter bethesdensis]APH54042.1 Ketopantoate reductase PanE/ApbA family protein [Granulibacter bethesdensis]APH61624.1 Ketopantoate reductase PanE/ApbA family protein [Granulibacter bethesdensis]